MLPSTFTRPGETSVGRVHVPYEVNASFFESVAAMAHTIDKVWSQDADVICSGSVQYTRLDGSQLSLPFATILTTEDGLIRDYKVYADVSPL